MKKVYYIAEDVVSNNPSGDLKIGVRIFYEKYNPYIEHTDDKQEGPYDNIKELKRKSVIYKSLLAKDPHRAQIIFEDKYIIKVTNYIFTDQNSSYSPGFMDLISHTTRGEIKKKALFGIHYFDDQRMRIKKMLKNENKNQIWKASIEIFDPNRNEWFEKESTFFPLAWSLDKLFHECDYAVKNAKKFGESTYRSFTLSGVLVEIIIKNQELKSIYPIYSGI